MAWQRRRRSWRSERELEHTCTATHAPCPTLNEPLVHAHTVGTPMDCNWVPWQWWQAGPGLELLTTSDGGAMRLTSGLASALALCMTCNMPSHLSRLGGLQVLHQSLQRILTASSRLALCARCPSFPPAPPAAPVNSSGTQHCHPAPRLVSQPRTLSQTPSHAGRDCLPGCPTPLGLGRRSSVRNLRRSGCGGLWAGNGLGLGCVWPARLNPRQLPHVNARLTFPLHLQASAGRLQGAGHSARRRGALGQGRGGGGGGRPPARRGARHSLPLPLPDLGLLGHMTMCLPLHPLLTHTHLLRRPALPSRSLRWPTPSA